MANLAAVPADMDTAGPALVAPVLGTTEAGLAQMRTAAPVPSSSRPAEVLYRWSDVRQYLNENTCQRTDDPRGGAA